MFKSFAVSASFLALSAIAAPPATAADVTPDVYEQIRNHVTCYPFGLDKIGAGDDAGGKEIWKNCFAQDYQFTISIPGQTIVCPGEKCPFPKEMDSVSMRAGFARRAYDVRKFVRTAHHLTNITITAASDDRAEVKAYLQAWHQRADNISLIGSANWDVALAKRDGKWLIVRENLKIGFEGLLEPPAGVHP